MEFLVKWGLFTGAYMFPVSGVLIFAGWLGSLWAGSTELAPGIFAHNPNPVEWWVGFHVVVPVSAVLALGYLYLYDKP